LLAVVKTIRTRRFCQTELVSSNETRIAGSNAADRT
jgi:hypothetical protein